MPDPDDPMSWNPYSYVRNNPANRVDPTGNMDDFVGDFHGSGSILGARDIFEPLRLFGVRVWSDLSGLPGYFGGLNYHKGPYVLGDVGQDLFYGAVDEGITTYDSATRWRSPSYGAQDTANLMGPLSWLLGGAGLGRLATRSLGNVEVPEPPDVHKNSLEYVGDTHVYRIVGPDGSTYKIGESAQGVRVGDGASKRGEQQARALTRETGEQYESQIRQHFPGKREARSYETRVIERFRRIFGQESLPGNKTNR